MVDARLLRLPHGAARAPCSRRGPRRVPVLGGDGQTVRSRLVKVEPQAARATRRAPGCLDRSSEASKTGRLARHTQRRRVERQLGAIFRRETLWVLWEVPQCVRALVRPCPAAHAPRVPSRDARSIRWPRRSPSAYPRTCCGSSRCVSARPSRVRGFPAIPKRAIAAGGVVTDARIALGARAVSVTHARSANHSRSFPPPFHARRHRSNATRPNSASRASFNRAPSRGSHSQQPPRLQALLSAGFPNNRPRRGSAFLRANALPRSASSRHTRCYLPHMYRLRRGAAAAAERRHARFLPMLGPFRVFAQTFCARPGAGRLLYNLVSAATLHFLLLRFTPLTTPIVATLPFPERAHTVLSVTCLLGALVAMLADRDVGCSALVSFEAPPFATPRRAYGRHHGTGVSGGAGNTFGRTPSVRVYRDAEKRSRHAHALGAACFVCSRASHPPENATRRLPDSGVAALYLRRRSSSFRAWVASVEGAHC